MRRSSWSGFSWNNFGIIKDVSMVQSEQLICLLGHALYFFINQVFMLTGALRFKTEFARYAIILSVRLKHC